MSIAVPVRLATVGRRMDMMRVAATKVRKLCCEAGGASASCQSWKLDYFCVWKHETLVLRSERKIHFFVLAGIDPAIHVTRHMSCRFPGIPGTRPGKTIGFGTESSECI